MIKRMQRKFVLMCMLSLLVVLAVIIVGMNIVNYHNTVAEADELLELLSENQGQFPSIGGGHGGKLPPNMSPELPYETRYFTVSFHADSGKIIQANTGRIAAVDTAKAIEYAQQAEGERGFVGEYRFIRQTENGVEQLVFMDCGRKLDACRSFLINSLTIAAIGYCMVFLLVLFFSNRIVRPLSQSYEKQKRFITDAGHELKTPLTIIRADADVLEMELGGNEWLEDIQKQADRLSALTEDLVYLARMEESEKTAVLIDFPISDVVTETAQSFLAPAQTQNKKLELAVTPMLSAKGDEKAISQLVNILLDNALKYSPADSQITLRLEKQGRNIHLSVTNATAETMSREQLSALFDRFYRGDSSRTSRGHGIGLSIAKAVALAHGGKITADTPADRTLRITALLPQ